MSEPDANFLSRWSRLKQRDRVAASTVGDGAAALAEGAAVVARVPAAAGSAPAAKATLPASGEQADPAVPALIDEPLPPVESLTADSDFRPFMRAGIDATTRNAALKRLFADPAFNVMDGLDVYIDDYGKTEPIPSALLRRLVEAQSPVLADTAAGPAHDLPPTAGRAGAPPEVPAEAAGQPGHVGDDTEAAPAADPNGSPQ